jgi:hypothetical protein
MKVKIFFTVVAIATVAAFMVLPIANAETKKCQGDAKQVGYPFQTTLNLDDVPQHVIQLTHNVHDHTSTCPEIGDFRQLVYEYSDSVAGSGTGTGYWTDVTKAGDKFFGKHGYTFKTDIKADGSWEMTFSGEWEATGGMGKFEGIKGKGTMAGKATPEGMSYNWEGSFDFPN